MGRRKAEKMLLTIRATTDVFHAGTGTLRIWRGTTATGIPIDVYVGAVVPTDRRADFEAEAKECGLLKSTFKQGKIGTRRAMVVEEELKDADH